MDPADNEEISKSDFNLVTIGNALRFLGKRCKSIDIDYAKTLSRVEKANQETRTTLLKKIGLQNAKIKFIEEKLASLQDNNSLIETIQQLKSDLQSGKETHSRETEKLQEEIEKLKEANEKKNLKINNLEQRLEDIEFAAPPTPSVQPEPANSTGQETLNLLNTLNDEMRLRFDGWNNNQRSIQEEVEQIKEIIGELKQIRTSNSSAQTVLPPDSTDDNTSPRDTEINDLFGPISPENDEDVDVAPSPFAIPVTFASMLPPAPPPPQMSSLSQNFDPFEFSEEYADPPSVAPCSQSSERTIIRPTLNHLLLQNKTHGIDTTKPALNICLCGQPYQSKKGLQKHIKRCEKTNFKCKFCQRTFHGKNLATHLKVSHHLQNTDPNTQTGIKCLRCGVSILYSQRAYDSHKKNCGKEVTSTTITPSTSTARVRSKSRVQQQTKHGVSSTKRQCLCGRFFGTQNALIKHLSYYRNKTKARNICRYCNRSFGYDCHLRTHLTRQHRIYNTGNSLNIGPPSIKPEPVDNAEEFQPSTTNISSEIVIPVIQID